MSMIYRTVKATDVKGMYFDVTNNEGETSIEKSDFNLLINGKVDFIKAKKTIEKMNKDVEGRSIVIEKIVHVNKRCSIDINTFVDLCKTHGTVEEIEDGDAEDYTAEA